MDGELDQADPVEAITRIVVHLRGVRPQVVITFGPKGGYGHPDHIAISQLTTAAVVCAADANYTTSAATRPHRVVKLYYKIWSHEEIASQQAVIGHEVTLQVNGDRRRPAGWPSWAVTTWLQTGAYWPTVRQAIVCHCSQLTGGYEALTALPEARLKQLWQKEGFYRVYSLVNNGHHLETDLFAGLQPGS
jgi:LmbE family N-acetylglucosaminyl deacetylase